MNLVLNAHGGSIYVGSLWAVRLLTASDGIDIVVLAAAERQRKTLVGELSRDDPPRTVHVIKAPLDDDDPLRPGRRAHMVMRIERAARGVVEAVRNRHNVLVSCAQGRNRSGAVAAAAIVRLIGVSFDEAVAIVRKGRGQDSCGNDALNRIAAEISVRSARRVSPVVKA
jgi:hypothetical protein